jgi:hypothetical protein
MMRGTNFWYEQSVLCAPRREVHRPTILFPTLYFVNFLA